MRIPGCHDGLRAARRARLPGATVVVEPLRYEGSPVSAAQQVSASSHGGQGSTASLSCLSPSGAATPKGDPGVSGARADQEALIV